MSFGKPQSLPFVSPFGKTASDLPPPAAPRPRLGLGELIRQSALAPFRLAGLAALLLLALPGLMKLVSLPMQASSQQVDADLVAYRLLDRSRVVPPFVTPLWPLGDFATLQSQVVMLAPPRTPEQRLGDQFLGRPATAVLVDRQQESVPMGGTLHRLRDADGSERTITSVTFHYNPRPGELDLAEKNLAKLFPSAASQAALREWGESLHWSLWLRQQPLSVVPFALIPEPTEATKAEQLWLAWRMFAGDSPDDGADLFRLGELFEEAFPETPDYVAALNWGKALYERMEADFQAYQADLKATLGNAGSEKTEAAIVANFKRVLPPNTTLTHAWLVYRYYGLTPASRQVALKRWERWFASDRHDAVMSFGAKVAEERHAAQEPLPPIPESQQWVCAIERIVGTDGAGKRAMQAATDLVGFQGSQLVNNALQWSNLQVGLQQSLLARDRMESALADPLDLSLRYRPLRIWLPIGLAVLMALAVQGVIHWLLAIWVLDAYGQSRWYAYLQTRGAVPIWLLLISLGLGVVLVSVVPMVSVSEIAALQRIDPGDQFGLGVQALVMGVMLLMTLRLGMGLVLLAFGIDLERLWLDWLLAVGVTAAILLFFGHPIAAIGVIVLVELLPAVVLWCSRRHESLGIESHWVEYANDPRRLADSPEAVAATPFR
ncbi:hypothetical protein [Tuwongella immobilis]|uniref:Uncharacterized protein n=1 Tax=Tuwongella immobilis TaxID=692036 RepID=A0A6C2YHL7_9BACT|nr:hypothetical protein [Tuwongella immobilis]VIP01018.1 unnamed protein product [Tuwongella immobilis]VTR97461.1 unnamed protein product [Tuwongella immobilis]